MWSELTSVLVQMDIVVATKRTKVVANAKRDIFGSNIMITPGPTVKASSTSYLDLACISRF